MFSKEICNIFRGLHLTLRSSSFLFQEGFFRPVKTFPIASMYDVFTYIYIRISLNQPNVGKYIIHGLDPMGLFE